MKHAMVSRTNHERIIDNMKNNFLCMCFVAIFVLVHWILTETCFAVWTQNMIAYGTMGCPNQKSAWCHFGTIRRIFLRQKPKWSPDISRSNIFFQQIKPGTSVIPHFYVILTEQSISCLIFMTQGHLQGQNVNLKIK